MKKWVHFLFTSILLSAFLSGCADSGANMKSTENNADGDIKIEKIIAFGDSYSDNGASFEISKKMVDDGVTDAAILPGDLYWQNRWTNGPTAVEVLAEKLDAELIDYAVGGAKSGPDNYYHWMNPHQDTGVLGQVEAYENTLENGKADPEALYFIFISANDFFEHTDYALPGTVTDLADQAVDNVKTAVAELADLGAEHYMIVNSSDLTMLPAVTAAGQTELADTFQTQFNTSLRATMQTAESNLDVDIIVFDHIAVSNRIQENPAHYGITNMTDACQPVYPEVKPECAAPDEYYFWDEWHPTRRVHQIVGEAM